MMENDINFIDMSAIEYIDIFISNMFHITGQSYSYDISNYDSLAEAYNVLRKIRLQTALLQCGEYTIAQGTNNNGDAHQIGIKRFLSDLELRKKEGKITSEQQKDIKDNIFSILFSDLQSSANNIFSSVEGIPFENIMFFLYEYVYRTPTHTNKYNFDSLDMRRNVFGRLEIASLNKFHDYKLNKENFQDIFLNTVEHFSLTIEQILSMILNNKEVEYRTELLNRSYFNMEHFLSILVEHFSIPRPNTHSKQALLGDVLDYFDIPDEIILKDVTDDVISRCVESDINIKNLFNNTRPTKQKMTDIFLRLINMRNSLHSNGFVSKNENALRIGEVIFSRTQRGQQHNSMGLLNVVTLLIFMSYILEKIVDASFKRISNTLIEDRYLREMQDHRNANEENSHNDI